MPRNVDETEQEEAHGTFSDGHADNGKALADAFVQCRLDNIFNVPNLVWCLPKTVESG